MNLFSFIKQKLSILDIVSEYTTLKKAGLYWKGCCPLHHEKTPSFTVSPHKEIFYCFGCHAGGDVITFVSKVEHCSPLEAAQHLADRYNIILPQQEALEQAQAEHEEKLRYIKTCTLFAQWVHANLSRNSEALNYLQKRSITKESIKLFKLGYCPAGPQAVKNLLAWGQKHAVLAKDFVQARILLEGKSGLYCPFDDRIIFVIKDHLGRICGFGGRVFKEHDDRAKYYNSHDHKFFNKSALLFGLDQAKKNIQEKQAVFMVEGYTDVIAMMQHNYVNTVATLGTACTQEHLKQLNKYCQKIYIVYDADKAGKEAILRLLPLCWQVTIDLYVILLPQGEDPASYLAKQEKIDLFIEQAQDIFTFFINQLGMNFETKSLQERINLTKQLITIIGNIEDPLKQEIVLQQGAKALQLPVDRLKQELRKPAKAIKSIKEPEKPALITKIENNNDLDKISQLEKNLFSAILYYKGAINPEDEELLVMWLPQVIKEFLHKLLIIKRTSPEADNKIIFDIFSQEEQQIISKWALEAEESSMGQSYEQLLLQFYKKQWKRIVHSVKLNIERAQKVDNSERVTFLLEKLELLKKKMLQRGIS